ncbi:hypothetical protein SDC9_167967 [bioreactor metagenome]|uniref:Uncharacterized protein n=1 Tax=bioreactor metagenome TaxID=1076179 RepID=A0A645G180_9ZZZZ
MLMLPMHIYEHAAYFLKHRSRSAAPIYLARGFALGIHCPKYYNDIFLVFVSYPDKLKNCPGYFYARRKNSFDAGKIHAASYKILSASLAKGKV